MNTIIQAWKLLFCLALVSQAISQPSDNRIRLTTKIVHLGEGVKLTCAIEAEEFYKDRLSIEWEKPAGTVIAQGPEITIKNVQTKDIGSYICKASGVVEGRIVSQSKTEEVIVEERPAVSTVIDPEITVPQSVDGKVHLFETQSLNLNCNVGNWKREEYEVQWINVGEYFDAGSEHLRIASVLQSKDQKVYICSVQHKQNLEKIFRKSVSVVIEVPQLDIKILPTERLTIGGLIHRKCIGFQFDQSTETFEYTWVDPSGRQVSKTDTIQMPIISLSESGKYKCQYQAHISGKRYEMETDVNVATQKQTGEFYTVSILEMPKRFRMGERLSLRCSVSPTIENISYTWSLNKEFIQTGDTIVIESFSKKDLGIYRCNAVGKSQSGTAIDLTADSFQDTHVFKNHQEEMVEGKGTQIEVNMGQSKELNCQVPRDSGHTGRDVIWHFNGKQLESEDDLIKYRLVREDRSIASILLMSTTNSDNDGLYTCSVGGIKKSATIIVREEKGLLTLYPKLEDVFEGTLSELHCKINNIPNARKEDIEWRFVSKDGSRKISLPDNRWQRSVSKKIPLTGYLVINSLELIDNGIVICSLPTGEEATSEIIVKKKPTPFRVIVSKPKISVRKLQKFEFECFSEDKSGIPSGNPVLKFSNGSLVSENPMFKISNAGQSRIRLVALNGIDIDAKQLKMICGVDELVAIVTIDLETTCPPNYRYCKNGDCLQDGKFCDGIKNCADGSDEDPKYCGSCDPIRKPCGPTTGLNSTVPFYDIHTACNGVNDCENGFDERNCAASADQQCNTVQFTCNNGLHIPYAYVCDAANDCEGGEDEIGCQLPTIVKMSNMKILAREGSDVKLMCEATGLPKPKIIWRYNWRCLPDETRMTTTEESSSCRNVASVLTIKNFQTGDDAFYTCEALGGTDRHLSQPIEVRFTK